LNIPNTFVTWLDDSRFHDIYELHGAGTYIKQADGTWLFQL